MGLNGRSVRKRPSDRLSRRIHRRRDQIRVVLEWMSTMGSGERVSLKAMCRERGVDTSGITKVLNDPKIQERIEAAIGTSSIYGLQMATRRLVLMLEDQEDLSVMDLTRITDHLAKLRYGGYARSEESTGPSVAVQINVPPHMDREEAVRVEAREKAKEELGDSVV